MNTSSTGSQTYIIFLGEPLIQNLYFSYRVYLFLPVDMLTNFVYVFFLLHTPFIGLNQREAGGVLTRHPVRPVARI